jgi:hypothetical protein
VTAALLPRIIRDLFSHPERVSFVIYLLPVLYCHFNIKESENKSTDVKINCALMKEQRLLDTNQE